MPASAVFPKNRKVYLDGYDLSGEENDCSLVVNIDSLERTAWGDGAHLFTPGLESFSLSQKGYLSYGADAPEEIIFTRIKAQTAHIPVSVSNPAGLDGENCFFAAILEFGYKTNGVVGQLPSFDLVVEASKERLIRGTILTAASANKTATFNGTARQVGAVAAGKKLYAIAHVIATPTGTTPTLDLKIQSADLSDMVGATDRITFTQVTTLRGAQFATAVAGPITDDWWRVVGTITGTTPSYKLFVAIGIE